MSDKNRNGSQKLNNSKIHKLEKEKQLLLKDGIDEDDELIKEIDKEIMTILNMNNFN